MKKFLVLLLCLLMLAGCGTKEEVVEEEPLPEPIAYSEDILLLSKSGTSYTVEDLTDKKICIQSTFDKELMDYVKGELINNGVSEENFVEANAYTDIPFMFDQIDAWVIPADCNEMVYDFLHDYKPGAQHLIETYNMPIYEKDVLDSSIASNKLYSKPFAVMLTGVDEKVDPDESKGKARNDVNILMVVNPEKKHILTVSFPRDSYIYSVGGQYSDKLTHLSFYRGPEDVKDSIGNLLDIEVPYYTQVSFSTFTKIVDSLGGVYVDVPLDMTMDQDSNRDVSKPYSLEKGENVQLYGEWALALARNRKYGVYNGDYGRIRNQALLVNGLVKKIADHPFLMDWVGVNWFFDYMTNNNFSEDDLAALVELAKTFNEGYTIDNYFIENVGSMTESGMSIGLCTDHSINIAKGKVELVMNGTIASDHPNYEEIMTGYITGGAGSYSDGYIGSEYSLKDIFN